MDKNIEEMINRYINCLVRQLFELAEKDGRLCVDEYGTMQLKGIPSDWMIETVCAALPDEILWSIMSGMEVDETQPGNTDQMMCAKEEKVKETIKGILKTNFAEIYQEDDEPQQEYMEIIGYQTSDTEEWVSCFFSIALYEASFAEADEMERSAWVKRMISIPCKGNIALACSTVVAFLEEGFRKEEWLKEVQETVQRGSEIGRGNSRDKTVLSLLEERVNFLIFKGRVNTNGK